VDPGYRVGGGGGPLGGGNIFCDLFYKSPSNKPNSAHKEVGKFRCTAKT
jgi:hypothetical protein